MAMATRVTGCSAQLPNAFLLTQRQQHFTFKKQQQQQQQHQRLLLSVTAAGTSLLSSSSSVIENINSVEEEKEEKNGNEKFEWSEHWYPVSLIEDLDPKVPTPFQLLGKQIVIWKDTVSDTWKAFIDKCPHRLAPLSEGRIDENGCLQCAYHGWSFRGDGTCARIPQADPSSQEAKAVLSPKACVSNTYPTIVSQGLLFVWPGDKGWEKSHSVQPPKLPSVFDNDPNFSTVTIQRDLFYGYDTLMENVSDPSHINFAHHKVTGRRDRAKPLPFKLTSTGYWGFTGCNSDTPKITAEFYAPCYVINKIEIPVSLPLQGSKVWEIYICSFNIPMAPGKTRSIVCSARNFFRFLMPGPAWWQLVPRWHEHWTSNKVYDGDMIVLQGQEKMLLASNQEYSRLTYTPTQADRLVIAFRSWLRRYGNGQPEWADDVDSKQPLPSTVLSKREMLDRYEQHTKKCSSCRGGLELFGVMEKIMLGVTITLAATAGIPTDKIFRIAMASACVMSGLLFFIFRELQQNFVFKDYVHAKID